MLAVGSAIIGAIIWYVNKRLSDNIDSVVQELEKIEEGNLENLTIQTDIQEFDELIARINPADEEFTFELGLNFPP